MNYTAVRKPVPLLVRCLNNLSLEMVNLLLPSLPYKRSQL